MVLHKSLQNFSITFCRHQIQSAWKFSQEAFTPTSHQSERKFYDFKMFCYSTKNHLPVHSSRMSGAPVQPQKQIGSSGGAVRCCDAVGCARCVL